jgi:hypothetical protein
LSPGWAEQRQRATFARSKGDRMFYCRAEKRGTNVSESSRYGVHAFRTPARISRACRFVVCFGSEGRRILVRLLRPTQSQLAFTAPTPPRRIQVGAFALLLSVMQLLTGNQELGTRRWRLRTTRALFRTSLLSLTTAPSPASSPMSLLTATLSSAAPQTPSFACTGRQSHGPPKPSPPPAVPRFSPQS